MKIADSVRKAIADWQQGDPESAMLHACNAVDGTARKLYPKLGSRERFTRVLRENYRVLGPMGAPGIDLVNTRWPVDVKAPTALGGKPDVADVLYGIHRCCHAHGDELPEGFELVPDAAGPNLQTRMLVEKGKVRLSDPMIFGLLAVAVLSLANKTEVATALNGYFLTFGPAKLIINDWWGRAADFAAIAAKYPLPLVKLDFGDWS